MISLLAAMLMQQGRVDVAPKLGESAPPVIAKILGSTKNFDMSQNKGKKVTVLVFGSCT